MQIKVALRGLNNLDWVICKIKKNMLLNPFQKAYEITYFEHAWLAKSRLNWMIVTIITNYTTI